MKERLDILYNSKTISEETYLLSLKIYRKYFENKNFDQDKVSVFITHFAMAVDRIKKGEFVDKFDATIIDQIKNSDAYDKALEYWNLIKAGMKIDIPESEEDYFILHLCNIFSER